VAIALLGGTALSAALNVRAGVVTDFAPMWVSAIVIAVHTLPLALRRRFPAIVAVIISVAFFFNQQLVVPELTFSNISLFVAIYTLGAWGRRRRVATVVRLAIIVAMFVWVTVMLVISVGDPAFGPEVSRAGVFSQYASLAVIQFLTNALYFGAAYYFGEAGWRAARQRSELERRTVELADERERTAAQAVALDRVRIARELHDVVAHHVSVMGVQAGAARRVLTQDPDVASASLATIEQNARTAVEELHRMLTTLREDDAAPASDSSSTRGIDQLDELVAGSGLPATLHVVGERRPVTSMAGFTLYRVAQEALTNTRKHGGEHASVDVRLRYLDDAVEIEVADTGVGRSAAKRGTGLGITGMRERVDAVGGTLEVGPRSRGGYLVRARIPEATS
jgi:signal transduction histidine kinase